MGSFNNFLAESVDSLTEINVILDELDEFEMDQFGWVLYSEFFEEEEGIDEADIDLFTRSEVDYMIKELGPNMHDEILDMLEEYDSEDIDDSEDEEMSEGVSRRMASKNRNRKKRKFMANSKAALRKTAVARKRAARQNKAKKKRYYKANKTKIAAYQKSRNDNIKKGKHKVKMRRKAG